MYKFYIELNNAFVGMDTSVGVCSVSWSWDDKFLRKALTKMSSSFSNSFDSEIVLLGGQKEQQRPSKHSRVGTVTSRNTDDEEDLHIGDSVSIRSLTSNSGDSGDTWHCLFSMRAF